MILTKKVLVIALCLFIVLVSSIVPCLATEASSPPSVPVGVNSVFKLKASPTPVSGSVSIDFENTFAIGFINDSGSFQKMGSGFRHIQLTPAGQVLVAKTTNFKALGVEAYSGIDCILFDDPVSVPAVLFDYMTPYGASLNGVLESGKALFTQGLVFGSGIISFVLSSWITAIVLVLYVGIALFGIFRRLFKGA